MNIQGIIKKYRLRPQKKLGQNFLIDNNVRLKLCDTLRFDGEETVLEIGAGCGSLTAILIERAHRLIIVEPDERCVRILKDEIVQSAEHAKIVEKSFLDYDISLDCGRKKIKVIGNLPYYITTKILFHLAESAEVVDEAVLTVQKEVAERILALPGNKTYGRLTVTLRYRAEVEKLFDISPRSFYPVPDVTSTVLRLRFHANRDESLDETLFDEVVKALFQERRKQIENGLTHLKRMTISKAKAHEVLTLCGIDPHKRAEELMIKDFITITKKIAENA